MIGFKKHVIEEFIIKIYRSILYDYIYSIEIKLLYLPITKYYNINK